MNIIPCNLLIIIIFISYQNIMCCTYKIGKQTEKQTPRNYNDESGNIFLEHIIIS